MRKKYDRNKWFITATDISQPSAVEPEFGAVVVRYLVEQGFEIVWSTYGHSTKNKAHHAAFVALQELLINE